MPSAYLQWRFHSGEVVVARGSFFFFLGGWGGGGVCHSLSLPVAVANFVSLIPFHSFTTEMTGILWQRQCNMIHSSRKILSEVEAITRP